MQTLQISTKSTAQFLSNSSLKNGTQKKKFPIWKNRLSSSYAIPSVTVCAQSGRHLHRHLHVSCADRTFSAAAGLPVCRLCSVNLPQKSVQCWTRPVLVRKFPQQLSGTVTLTLPSNFDQYSVVFSKNHCFLRQPNASQKWNQHYIVIRNTFFSKYANRYFPYWKILFLSSIFKSCCSETMWLILLKFAKFAPERWWLKLLRRYLILIRFVAVIVISVSTSLFGTQCTSVHGPELAWCYIHSWSIHINVRNDPKYAYICAFRVVIKHIHVIYKYKHILFVCLNILWMYVRNNYGYIIGSTMDRDIT